MCKSFGGLFGQLLGLFLIHYLENEKVTRVSRIPIKGRICLLVAWGNFAFGSIQTPGKNQHSDTRQFHEHKLAVGGTTLCTMVKIYAHAVFFKSKRPNSQI